MAAGSNAGWAWVVWRGGFAAAWLCCAAAAAQPALAPVTALRLSPGEQIVVDGRLDDAAWSRAEPLSEFWEVEPGDRVAPQVRTDARFLYDGVTLYMALRAWDPDMAALRASLSRRDDMGSNEDHITLYIDPTGQRRFAQFFNINPRGVVADGLYNEQNSSEDVSPNFRFTARGGVFDGGWSVELAIPFASLRYAGTALQRWNVLVTRNYPRDRESYYFASAPLPHDANCMLCYSRPLLGLTELPAGRSLDLKPTLTVRRSGEREGDAPRRATRTVRAGVDVKWRLRPELVLDGTLRPDFSQVEIDAPQLSSNTRYAIYFPEKRPFFLEGADILQSPLPVLQTRSIAAPDWGLRLTRRSGDADLVAIVARDSATGETLLPGPWGTDTVRRTGPSLATLVRGRVPLGAATLGGVFTERRYTGDLGVNRVAGLDVSWNPVPQTRVDLQWLHSTSSALQRTRGVPSDGRAWLARWSHKGDRWSMLGAVTDHSIGFRGDNGFFQEAGLRKYEAELFRKQRDVGPFNEVSAFSKVEHKVTRAGETVQRSARAGFGAVLPLETSVWVAPLIDTRARAGPGLTLHRLRQHELVLESVPSRWLGRLRIKANFGEQLDIPGDRVGLGHNLSFEAELRPWHRLQIGYQLSDLRIGARAGSSSRASERAQQLVTLLHLAPDHHLRLILQSRIGRRDDPLDPDRQQDWAGSLTYQVQLAPTVQLDAGLSVGSIARSVPLSRSEERDAFLKVSWDLER